jgi:hypothetical protein
MARFEQPPTWSINDSDSYIPLLYEGSVIGFCKPEFASQIAQRLNENETVRKALHEACRDLASRIGTTTGTDLVQQYLERVERPKSGTGAIALLLQQRQEELDLTNEEFAKFCDTFRLSRDELKNIYAGEAIESHQLSALSRILGMTIDELIQTWKGK